MDSSQLIVEIQDALQSIPDLRTERQAIGSPRVKAWKTRVEQVLRLGGKNTSKLLQNFQNLKFGAGAMGSEMVASSEVKFQTYQAELDAAGKMLQNAVQTIRIFGVSEEQKLPDWFKQEVKAAGLIRIGGKEVDIRTVTMNEFLSAILSLVDGDKSLDDSLKQIVGKHIESMQNHPLLQPFLNQTLDKAFAKLG